MKQRIALTIAGSDSGGGAGIQADLKTFQELGVYGMSAITAVTAQNTLGVAAVYPMSLESIEKQIDAVATDIGTDAIKTGMLFDSGIIELVAAKIRQYEWKNIVVDPVMIAKGGASLLQNAAVTALKEHLIPLATVITPNIPEAEVLTGLSIRSMDERKEAAVLLHSMGAKHVVIKGGHGDGDNLVDLLYDGSVFFTLDSKRLNTKNTHGTGCTFAAAMAASLANGLSVRQSFETAKEFVYLAIKHDLNIGQGHGPTNHWAYAKMRASSLQ
ncbi:bifunctional hydroxymethylpyrimidine kinase/phosphomethylpyrimidine kinase [Niallia sp. MER 6]|uniref:bifunctional hydroxymethylpyrimidine kinase/phosphomethylpyrimidine kinase n=1 Tax=unclassified Niallia TaxID=2837522 RepID=UPI00203C7D17|nr:bifunctional hydroxymethylpyrimidine kinase/phosphomethylpyrimidine kinase [Niallia sp. MER 6]MCM3030788.1 bifunctional hydroxymethylpyrimidine kinase/phosphomethylpyrimidine kinase [Niallia sp. MER 6]